MLRFLVGLLLCMPANAQVGPIITGPALFMPKPAVSYTGPGDIVSGATFWGSCQRSYSAAYATGSNPSCNIRRASDNHTCDLLIASSGTVGNTSGCSIGGDNGQSASSFCNATTCSIDKIYDQSQSNACGGGSCDAGQATAANQPPLKLPGAGVCINASVNCINLDAASAFFLTSVGAATVSQPLTMNEVINNSVVSSPSAGQNVLGLSNNGGNVTVYANGTNAAAIFAGSYGNYTAANSTWLAMSDVFNGISSIANVNGTETTVNSGANTIASFLISFSWTNAGTANTGPTGPVEEYALWPSGFSGTNRTAICRNQQAYYGSGNFGAAC